MTLNTENAGTKEREASKTNRERTTREKQGKKARGPETKEEERAKPRVHPRERKATPRDSNLKRQELNRQVTHESTSQTQTPDRRTGQPGHPPGSPRMPGRNPKGCAGGSAAHRGERKRPQKPRNGGYNKKPGWR